MEDELQKFVDLFSGETPLNNDYEEYLEDNTNNLSDESQDENEQTNEKIETHDKQTTAPTEPPESFPTFINTPAKTTPSAKAFFEQLLQVWDSIAEMLKNPELEIREKGILTIEGLLPPHLVNFISFEATIGRINNIYMGENIDFKNLYNNRIELYISPKLSMDNLQALESIYNEAIEVFRNKIGNDLGIYKYRVFCEKDPFVDDIRDNSLVISSDQIGIQHQLGYDDKNNMRIHVVIGIDKAIANQILHEVEIATTPKCKKWLPKKSQIIDIFLLNAIGEYAMTNVLGYIEFLPVESLKEFEPLDVLRKLTVLDGVKCNICCRKKFQVKNLFRCSRCKGVLYCSEICQKLDWPEHMKLCNK